VAGSSIEAGDFYNEKEAAAIEAPEAEVAGSSIEASEEEAVASTTISWTKRTIEDLNEDVAYVRAMRESGREAVASMPYSAEDNNGEQDLIQLASTSASDDSEQRAAASATSGGEVKKAKAERAPRKKTPRKALAIGFEGGWDPAWTPPAVPKGSRPTPGGTRAVDDMTGEQTGTIETVTNRNMESHRICASVGADSPQKQKELAAKTKQDTKVAKRGDLS